MTRATILSFLYRNRWSIYALTGLVGMAALGFMAAAYLGDLDKGGL